MAQRTLKMTAFRLSTRGRTALNRIARKQGWTKTRTIERAIVNLEITLTQQPANAQ